MTGRRWEIRPLPARAGVRPVRPTGYQLSVLSGLLAAHRDTLGPVLLARAAEAARGAGRAEMQAMIDALEER